MIERLAKGDLYSMWISSCYLFPEAYTRSRPEQKAKLTELFYELCANDTPMVRWAAASCLGDFSKSIVTPTEELIEAFKKLLTDAQDAVKTETIKNSVVISELIMKN